MINRIGCPVIFLLVGLCWAGPGWADPEFLSPSDELLRLSSSQSRKTNVISHHIQIATLVYANPLSGWEGRGLPPQDFYVFMDSPTQSVEAIMRIDGEWYYFSRFHAPNRGLDFEGSLEWGEQGITEIVGSFSKVRWVGPNYLEVDLQDQKLVQFKLEDTNAQQSVVRLYNRTHYKNLNILPFNQLRRDEQRMDGGKQTLFALTYGDEGHRFLIGARTERNIHPFIDELDVFQILLRFQLNNPQPANFLDALDQIRFNEDYEPYHSLIERILDSSSKLFTVPVTLSHARSGPVSLGEEKQLAIVIDAKKNRYFLVSGDHKIRGFFKQNRTNSPTLDLIWHEHRADFEGVVYRDIQAADNFSQTHGRYIDQTKMRKPAMLQFRGNDKFRVREFDDLRIEGVFNTDVSIFIKDGLTFMLDKMGRLYLWVPGRPYSEIEPYSPSIKIVVPIGQEREIQNPDLFKKEFEKIYLELEESVFRNTALPLFTKYQNRAQFLQAVDELVPGDEVTSIANKIQYLFETHGISMSNEFVLKNYDVLMAEVSQKLWDMRLEMVMGRFIKLPFSHQRVSYDVARTHVVEGDFLGQRLHLQLPHNLFASLVLNKGFIKIGSSEAEPQVIDLIVHGSQRTNFYDFMRFLFYGPSLLYSEGSDKLNQGLSSDLHPFFYSLLLVYAKVADSMLFDGETQKMYIWMQQLATRRGLVNFIRALFPELAHADNAEVLEKIRSENLNGMNTKFFDFLKGRHPKFRDFLVYLSGGYSPNLQKVFKRFLDMPPEIKRGPDCQ